MGKLEGGGLLDQSVLISPPGVSWKEIVPTLVGASGAFPWSAVVHASTNDVPLLSLTVTFSVVGTVLYAVSDQTYDQVASAGCGSQPAPAAGAAATSDAAADATQATPRSTRSD
jgi:hypothetical protein